MIDPSTYSAAIKSYKEIKNDIIVGLNTQFGRVRPTLKREVLIKNFVLAYYFKLSNNINKFGHLPKNGGDQSKIIEYSYQDILRLLNTQKLSNKILSKLKNSVKNTGKNIASALSAKGGEFDGLGPALFGGDKSSDNSSSMMSKGTKVGTPTKGITPRSIEDILTLNIWYIGIDNELKTHIFKVSKLGKPGKYDIIYLNTLDGTYKPLVATHTKSSKDLPKKILIKTDSRSIEINSLYKTYTKRPESLEKYKTLDDVKKSLESEPVSGKIDVKAQDPVYNKNFILNMMKNVNKEFFIRLDKELDKENTVIGESGFSDLYLNNKYRKVIEQTIGDLVVGMFDREQNEELDKHVLMLTKNLSSGVSNIISKITQVTKKDLSPINKIKNSALAQRASNVLNKNSDNFKESIDEKLLDRILKENIQILKNK